MTNFVNKISKYGGYGFTNGQIEAIEKLDTWYNNPKDLFFTLSGRAGTGKTYLLKCFVDEIVKHPLCVSAPTHKAVRQIEYSTGKKGKTLQSLHGLRPNVNLEDFDLNNIKFDALGSPTFYNYKLIIIDECSMINKGLHTLNERRATDLGVKVLYVGDAMQIPPVNKNSELDGVDSPTFSLSNYYELSEIIRQGNNNPLIDLLEVIVKDIKGGTSNFISYLSKNPVQINSEGEGYKLVTDFNKFLEETVECFKSPEFSANTDYARVVAWKNKTVDNYNYLIRNKLIPHFSGPDSANELIDLNDLLIGYKTILNDFNETTIINSEDYIVNNIVYRKSDAGFHTYAVTLTPRHGGTSINIHIVDHRNASFMVFYDKIKYKYFNALYDKSMNRSSKWKEYFEYKNQFLSLITFPIKDGEDVKAYVTKDIDYAFCLTTHKLQGSTITNTFVDLNDMLFYTNGKMVTNSKFAPNAITMRNKLIYTALSRTSKLATIHL